MDEKVKDLEWAVGKLITDKKTKKKINIKHKGITCDSCGVMDFKGRRFKCLVCQDFDLCEYCEEKELHEHPMMRLVNKSRTQK